MSFTGQSGDVQELFPHDWVLTETVQTVVRVSPLGVCVLQAVQTPASDTAKERSRDELASDFIYLTVNDVLQAMMNLPVEDILYRTLRFLTHNTAVSELIDQLAQTVDTGKPGQCIETYQLDGVVRTYHQLYAKSENGVIMLIQDVTYNPLSSQEVAANNQFLQAVERGLPVAQIRALLLALISGQTS